jgi:hypothetical protein
MALNATKKITTVRVSSLDCSAHLRLRETIFFALGKHELKSIYAVFAFGLDQVVTFGAALFHVINKFQNLNVVDRVVTVIGNTINGWLSHGQDRVGALVAPQVKFVLSHLKLDAFVAFGKISSGNSCVGAPLPHSRPANGFKILQSAFCSGFVHVESIALFPAPGQAEVIYGS